MVVDVPEAFSSKVIDLITRRRGRTDGDGNKGEMQHLEFEVPSRGLIGLRTQMLTATTGEAVMAHRFMIINPGKALFPAETTGIDFQISGKEPQHILLTNFKARGTFFVDQGEEVYTGQILAENIKPRRFGS